MADPELVIRVEQGKPIPRRYRFKQWLGIESGLSYLAGTGYADVLLVTEPSQTGGDRAAPPSETPE